MCNNFLFTSVLVVFLFCIGSGFSTKNIIDLIFYQKYITELELSSNMCLSVTPKLEVVRNLMSPNIQSEQGRDRSENLIHQANFKLLFCIVKYLPYSLITPTISHRTKLNAVHFIFDKNK